jgi:hypothetical protein
MWIWLMDKELAVQVRQCGTWLRFAELALFCGFQACSRRDLRAEMGLVERNEAKMAGGVAATIWQRKKPIDSETFLYANCGLDALH